MEKNIFNVYVEMQDQAQCDRMKQLCVDNGLPIWEDENSFDITSRKDEKSWFWYDEIENEYFIVDLRIDEIPLDSPSCEATKIEFIELLKQYKNE